MTELCLPSRRQRRDFACRAAGIAALVGALLFGWAGQVRAEADSFGLGTGRDGALSVSAAGTSINSYASLTANVAVGASVLPVDTTVGFAVGNVVLIWQTTGLAASEAPNGVQTPIALAGKNTGHYELGRIEALGATSITLTNPLIQAYRSGTAQVVRVPEYTTVTIGAAGTLVPGQAWNGSKGGVVAFLATGAITNNGVISADAAGFRGGPLVNHGTLNNCNASSMGVPSDGTPANGYSPKGEGLVNTAYTDTIGGRTNVANGGGGGVCHNSGGGGGGHGGPGGLGGRTWMGDGSGRLLGGYGGAALTYDPLSFLSFGGGGGSGDQNNNVGTRGGNGGGLVFIRGGSLTGGGTIRANGEKPTRAGGMPAANDAAGGGGAGGAIYLRLAGTAACGAIQANGGGGGDVQFGSSPASDPHGPGGGGGGGRIYFERASGGTCTTQAQGGAAGRWNGMLTHGAEPVSAGDAMHLGVVTAINTAYAGMACSAAQIAAGTCGGCVFASECGGSTPACVLAGNTCQPCNANFGGMGVTCPTSAAPICVLSGASAGACVVCTTDAHCSGNPAGPLCDTGKNTCGTCTATNTSACTGTTPACNRTPANNVCAACNGDFGSSATQACPSAGNPACVTMGSGAGSCVQCTSSAQCASHPNGPICNTTKRTCGTCAPGQTAACVGTTPICDTSGAFDQCRACNGDFGTSATRACLVMSAPFCVTTGMAAGACVGCRSNADCGGVTPICGAMTAVCEPCDADFGSGSARACPTGSAPFCAIGVGSCSNVCTLDVQCGAGNWCNAGACQPRVPNGMPVPGGTCVAMLAARACVSGVCDPTDDLCGIRPGGMGCGDGDDCRAGVCVAMGANAGTCLDCNVDGDCAGTTPVCHPSTNRCVACGAMNTSQCAGPTPVCDVATGACVPCDGDAGSGRPAACPTMNPYCHADGACGRCTGNADCATGMRAGPICNTTTGACGTMCGTDVDCAATQYCDNPSGSPFAGTCTPKLPNGQPIPAGAPFGGQCTGATAMRVCVSGVCDTQDDRCGLPNGEDCASAAVCRSDLCHDDGRCGLPNGQPCSAQASCRSDICHADGRCGLPGGEACQQASDCRAGECLGDRCPVAMADGGAPDGGAGDAGGMDGGAGDAAGGDAAAGDAPVALDAPGESDDGGGQGGRDAGAGGAGGQDAGAGDGSAGDAGIDLERFDGIRIGGGGCSCDVGGDRRGDGWLPLLIGLAFVLWRRRRR